MENEILSLIDEAARLIKKSKYVVAFTGAGMSVDSGLPLYNHWNNFDPHILDINYFRQNPAEVWQEFKKSFLTIYPQAKPNRAHLLLKEMQDQRLIRGIISVNIDDLHQKAGSTNVHNVCGQINGSVCQNCAHKFNIQEISFEHLPPTCSECGGILKPDILFWGDLVPDPEYKLGMKEANRAKLMIIIGTSGTIMPAGVIPMFAKYRRHVSIIEINIQPTVYTSQITDIFIPLPAAEALSLLKQHLLEG